jgi:hypothetical protein
MAILSIIPNGTFEPFHPVHVEEDELLICDGSTIPCDHRNQFLPSFHRCAAQFSFQMTKEEEIPWRSIEAIGWMRSASDFCCSKMLDEVSRIVRRRTVHEDLIKVRAFPR